MVWSVIVFRRCHLKLAWCPNNLRTKRENRCSSSNVNDGCEERCEHEEEQGGFVYSKFQKRVTNYHPCVRIEEELLEHRRGKISLLILDLKIKELHQQ
jgi:hypothetical protein